MSDYLAAQIVWAVVALAALCGAIGTAYVFRHPLFAGERLDAAERRLAEQSSVIDELAAKVGQLELGQQHSESRMAGWPRPGR